MIITKCEPEPTKIPNEEDQVQGDDYYFEQEPREDPPLDHADPVVKAEEVSEPKHEEEEDSLDDLEGIEKERIIENANEKV